MKNFIFIFFVYYTSVAYADLPETAVNQVLDELHSSAAQADGEKYFALFVKEAVFIGTDATETWTLNEFKQFAEPYFSKGKGWKYSVTKRNLYFSTAVDTAWFDELLWNDKYGVCRGTGVLVIEKDQWKIAQYHLTIPIPNNLADEITKKIKASMIRE